MAEHVSASSVAQAARLCAPARLWTPRALLLAALAATLAATACSPEAVRTRNGGPGADVGNRSRSVELHGLQRQDAPQGMFYRTPKVGQAVAR